MGERAWRVLDGPNAIGPLSELDVVQGYQRGSFTDSTNVWSPHEQRWLSLDQAFDVASLLPPPLSRDLAFDAKATGAAPTSSGAASWATAPSFAWRRFFARQMDVLFLGLLMYWLGLSILAVWSERTYTAILSFSQQAGAQYALGVLITILSLLMSAIMIGVSGRTVGKLIFGVKILSQDRRPVGIPAALKREFSVFVHGLGLGLPLVSLIAALFGYQRLKTHGASSWDEAIGASVHYRRRSAAHFILMTLGIVVWAGSFIALAAIGHASR